MAVVCVDIQSTAVSIIMVASRIIILIIMSGLQVMTLEFSLIETTFLLVTLY